MRRFPERVILLSAFCCCCTSTPKSCGALAPSPWVLALESPSDLPSDLDQEAVPAVRIYLRNGTSERIDALSRRMGALGYYTDNSAADLSGAAELLFLVEPTEILQGQSHASCWAAAKLMIHAGIPFTWGQTQYTGLFVPKPLAPIARELLGQDPLLNPCVIESNGELRRDDMPRDKPLQPASGARD